MYQNQNFSAFNPWKWLLKRMNCRGRAKTKLEKANKMTGREEIAGVNDEKLKEYKKLNLKRDNDPDIVGLNDEKLKENKELNEGEKAEDSVDKNLMHEENKIQMEEVKEVQETIKEENSENESEESTENFEVQKGKGTPLKDIPNVVYKLEQKSTSFFAVMHCVLYGLHGEEEDFKESILQFSGFAQYPNEENQKDKIKERLEKCNKETLCRLCSVFDLPIPRVLTNVKKKEIITPLLEFMEAPYAIKDAGISHNEKSSRKRKLRRTSKNSSKRKYSRESDTSTSLETSLEETDKEEEDEDEETEENVQNTLDNNSLEHEENNNNAISGNSKDVDVNSAKEELNLEKYWNTRVAEGGDKSPEEWSDPSSEELKKGICDILDKIDITITTFSDVLAKLDENFAMDLSLRRDAIMVMIEDELYRLADGAQEIESNGDEDYKEK